MAKRDLTCIVCPRGCALAVELDGEGRVLSVTGNICKRGEKYAVDECTNPMRVVTSTVRCADGEVVSCKTADSIPKSLIFEVMKAINSTVAPAEVEIGDVVIENVVGTGVNVVITGNKH